MALAAVAVALAVAVVVAVTVGVDVAVTATMAVLARLSAVSRVASLDSNTPCYHGRQSSGRQDSLIFQTWKTPTSMPRDTVITPNSRPQLFSRVARWVTYAPCRYLITIHSTNSTANTICREPISKAGSDVPLRRPPEAKYN